MGVTKWITNLNEKMLIFILMEQGAVRGFIFPKQKIKVSAAENLSSKAEDKCPIIVMANGFGGTRQNRLYEYAEKFSKAGYACFLFDYRNYGDSDGNKRQLINAKMQLKDWNSTIDHIKKDGYLIKI